MSFLATLSRWLTELAIRFIALVTACPSVKSLKTFSRSIKLSFRGWLSSILIALTRSILDCTRALSAVAGSFILAYLEAGRISCEGLVRLVGWVGRRCGAAE